MADVSVQQSYTYPKYPFRRPKALDDGAVERLPLVIVGGGVVGLSAALEFAGLGVETVVLDDDDTVSRGSRSICVSKRTLEIFDRSGVADRMVDKGVVWQRGRVYRGEREIYNFDLLPEEGHKMPAFINLQQYYVEEYLIDRITDLGKTELRWRNPVTGIEILDEGGALLTVETPEGEYRIQADHVIAADGVRGAIRRAMGLAFTGRTFEERFLITDIRMTADFPMERRFWFEPSFHGGQSALLHRQPDSIFRVDLQLGPDADPVEEAKPERVIPRIRRMIGGELDFTLEWISVYTFTCRRIERFRHGPVFFVGDAAHVVSPFGARGGNGGIQDIDNLVWKLALVLKGEASDALLDSYDAERVPAADENILNSSRSTDFMTPKNQVSADFRQAVLSLSEQVPFARALVNSGRLSLPHHYAETPLTMPDSGDFQGRGPAPGSPAPDAPVAIDGESGWLLKQLGRRFVALCFAGGAGDGAGVATLTKELGRLHPFVESFVVVPDEAVNDKDGLVDTTGLAFERWGAAAGTVYLVRPDQHVAARWKSPPTIDEMRSALARSIGARTGSEGMAA
jgi:3-(3-hydroxy-phenyl)propionate hydroxylase